MVLLAPQHFPAGEQGTTLPRGVVFTDPSGAEFSVVPNPDFHYQAPGVADRVVADAAGQEYYVANKQPELQSFVSGLGSYLAAKDPALARLQFPRIQPTTLDDRRVGLVEFFPGHTRLPNGDPEQILTPDERAFLVVFNTLVGNRDHKAEHVLAPGGHGGKIVLIDFEKSFDFRNGPQGDIGRIRHMYDTLGDPDPKLLSKYSEMIYRLNARDWAEIGRIGDQSGYQTPSGARPERQIHDRAAILRDEIKELYGDAPRVSVFAKLARAAGARALR